MSGFVFGIVLLAALLHACWNALVKHRTERFQLLALINLCSALLAFPFILYAPPPHPDSWPYLAASVVIHLAYYLCLLSAYRHGDLGRIYPLTRGSAPLWVTLAAIPAAGEVLGATATLGTVIISLAIISLGFESSPGAGRRDFRPVLWALITGALIASYTVVDGLGARSAGTPLGYIGWLFFIDGWTLVLCAIVMQRGAFIHFARRHWRAGLGGGIATFTAYGLVIYALSLGAMGLVAALRETSVVFAFVIGVVFLGERATVLRLVAALMVAGGVVLLRV